MWHMIFSIISLKLWSPYAAYVIKYLKNIPIFNQVEPYTHESYRLNLTP